MKISDAKKIAIIGYPATGKSTFAHKFSEKLGIEVFSLDKLRWDKNGKKVAEKIFLKNYEKLFKNEKWIMEGNALSFVEERFRQADVVFLFETSRAKSVWQVIKRWFKNRIFQQERLGGGDDTIIHLPKFIIKRFPMKLAGAKKELEKYPEKVIVIKNHRNANKIISEIGVQK